MFSLGEKSKSRAQDSKKSQFYVEFLGWMECRGLRGQQYTDHVIRELRKRQTNMIMPPKLTVQVSKKNIKIFQDVEENAKKGSKKVKFPTIPSRDVTYVCQAVRPGDGRLDDIVACIFLGYMPRTQKYVHVYAYRFDDVITASLFVSLMNEMIESNIEHIQDVELDLIRRGEIDNPTLMPAGRFNDRYNPDSAIGFTTNDYDEKDWPNFKKEFDPDLQSLREVRPFDSVTDEFRLRLQVRDAPLLLPPKDYDTISRGHGNLQQINKRRCLNLNIVGENAAPSETSDPSVDYRNDDSEWSERSSDDSKYSEKMKSQETEALYNPPRNQQLHSPLAFKENNGSPQVPRKPAILHDSKFSPNTPDNPNFLGPENPYIISNSGKAEHELPTTGTSFVYPAKINSPRIPRMLPQSQKKGLSRHGSQNSITSDSSKKSYCSDNGQALTPTKAVKAGSNEDIYALPVKNVARRESETNELAPDYMEEDVLDNIQGYDQHLLMRSAPADIIRSGLDGGRRSRPNSEELPRIRRTKSPIMLKTPNTNVGMYSPQMHRYYPSNR